jgi:pyruvate/2-oxoglutarate dehydrogenase complex dihydrolipoamide acyltransferase (E2) component
MDVIMPQLGETVAEGKILAWFKNAGDKVNEGDNLFEVETDKVTVEVQAIAAGTLTEIRVGVGTVAKVGTVVAVIGSNGQAGLPAAAPSASVRPAAIALDVFNEVRTPPGRFLSARRADGVRITPLARRLIVQNGLDLAPLTQEAQTRGDGLIRASNVRTALQAAPAPAPAPTQALAPPPAPVARAESMPARLPVRAEDESLPINTIRQRTGQRLAESWRTAPHVFQAIEIDFGAVEAMRSRHKERFKARIGTALTYLPFIARAVCVAIREFPQVNARFDADRLLVSRDINLGIAVDLSHNGLVVPVVHRASELSFEDLARAMARQIHKARAGMMTPDDMSGGTYTITNNGSYGTLFTAPIINLPQAAILSTDAIRKRPAVVETPQGDFIAVRPMGIVAQSFDHRAFDGAYSAAYLSCLKEIVERHDWAREFD